LMTIRRGESGTFSYREYQDLHARGRALSGLAATLPMESDLEVDGESEFVAAEVVSANYADILGVRPLLGKWFATDSEPVAVISHALWQRRFHAHPSAIGQPIHSESQTYTIGAVAPPAFTGVFAPLRTDIWVPVRTRPKLAAGLEDRKGRPLFLLFGRLGPGGATALQASAELNSISQQLIAEQVSSPEVTTPIVVEHARGAPDPRNRRRSGTAATLLAAVVGLVLLIACVNVGNLLLVRGTVRAREFAMRRALGATRLRLLQQLLTESFVLAVAGGICGIVLARWTNQLLEKSMPSISGFAVQLNLSLDWRVLAFATVITLATTLLCGLLPAWRTSETRSVVPFKGEIFVGHPRRRPYGVIAQVIMSLALLLIAGTFLQAVFRMQTSDPGFAVADRLYAHTFISTPPSTLEGGLQFYARAVERLKTLPGIQDAALSRFLPLMPAPSDCAAAGHEGGQRIRISTAVVDTGYFKAMNIDLVSGRDFAPSDSVRTQPIVVVNESLAAQLWPNQQPVGELITLGCRESRQAVVVGVVRNSAVRSLGESSQPHAFLPFAQHYYGGLTTLVMKTSAPPATVVEPVRRTLRELGQGIRVYAVQPMSEHIEQSYGPIRWQASVLGTFGLLALLLAAMGLYGVIAYRVALRTHEIGVRMALGARRRDVFREVVTQGLSIALIGVLIGEVLAVMLTQLLGSVQSEIRPPGLIVHAATGLLWVAVAIVATYIPAARASRVDPLVALRCE
jgi:predicted permease